MLDGLNVGFVIVVNKSISLAGRHIQYISRVVFLLVKVSASHLLRSFISWKAFLMCVWLKVCIPPFTASSSESVAQAGRVEAGVATRLVRHERQCLDDWR